jgi:hypothetical protein
LAWAATCPVPTPIRRRKSAMVRVTGRIECS